MRISMASAVCWIYLLSGYHINIYNVSSYKNTRTCQSTSI